MEIVRKGIRATDPTLSFYYFLVPLIGPREIPDFAWVSTDLTEIMQ